MNFTWLDERVEYAAARPWHILFVAAIVFVITEGVVILVRYCCCGARQTRTKRVVGSGTAVVMENNGQFRAVLPPGRHNVIPGDKAKTISWFTSLMHQPRPTKHIKTQPFVVPCPVVTAPDHTGADVEFEYDVVAHVVDVKKAANASDNMLAMAEVCVHQALVDFAARHTAEQMQQWIRDSVGAARLAG